MTLTGKQANFLLDLLIRDVPRGVPVPYDASIAASVADLEKKGLVERHWVGNKRGAFLTHKGRSLIESLAQPNA
jgi:DNA-binding HxlR family transcriptional regulator